MTDFSGRHMSPGDFQQWIIDQVEPEILDPNVTSITLDAVSPPVGPVDFNSQKLTSLGTPTLATDAATKAYADSLAAGLQVKQSVRLATTANITLSGEQVIDSVTAVAGDRVLVKNQSTASQNGIYSVSAGAWSRTTDADTSPEVLAGMFTFVEAGTLAQDQGWVLATNNPITLGTTALTFTQFSGSGSGGGSDATLVTSDITTNNASTSKHGFAPKLNGSSGTFLNGVGGWTAPSGTIPAVKGWKSVTDYGALLNTFSSQNAGVLAAQEALTAEGGGVLYFPACSFLCLTAPITQKPGVRWVGAGKNATTLAFNLADTAVGVHAINPTGSYPLVVTDMNITGPFGGSVTPGSATCNANGLILSPSSVLLDLHVTRFNKCVSVAADHTTCERLLLDTSYTGFSFPTSSERADQAFRDSVIGGMALAAVHIPSGANNSLDNQVWEKVHSVANPFGFLKQGTSADVFINETSFIRCAFENNGNGAFVDLSTGGGPSWLHSVCEGSGWSQSDVYKYAGLLSGVQVSLPGACEGGYIRNSYAPFFTYNIVGTIEVIQSQTSPVTVIPTFAAGSRWLDDQGGVYHTYATTGTVAVGDLMEYATTVGTVQRASGLLGASGIIGVASQSATGGARISVKVKGGRGAIRTAYADAVASAGIPLVQKTGTLYQVTPATTSGSTTNPVIGYSANAGSGGFVVARMNFPE